MLSSLLQVKYYFIFNTKLKIDLQIWSKISFQNTTYYEALLTAWNSPNPSRSAMPSISRLQKLVETAWAQGFDVQVNFHTQCSIKEMK